MENRFSPYQKDMHLIAYGIMVAGPFIVASAYKFDPDFKNPRLFWPCMIGVVFLSVFLCYQCAFVPKKKTPS